MKRRTAGDDIYVRIWGECFDSTHYNIRTPLAEAVRNSCHSCVVGGVKRYFDSTMGIKTRQYMLVLQELRLRFRP